MKQTFILSPDNLSTTLIAENCFQQIILTQARLLEGRILSDNVPFVELILTGDSLSFTAHANRIPESDRFNCFDLFEAAETGASLDRSAFNRLQIGVKPEHYEGDFQIELEIDLSE